MKLGGDACVAVCVSPPCHCRRAQHLERSRTSTDNELNLVILEVTEVIKLLG